MPYPQQTLTTWCRPVSSGIRSENASMCRSGGQTTYCVVEFVVHPPEVCDSVWLSVHIKSNWQLMRYVSMCVELSHLHKWMCLTKRIFNVTACQGKMRKSMEIVALLSKLSGCIMALKPPQLWLNSTFFFFYFFVNTRLFLLQRKEPLNKPPVYTCLKENFGLLQLWTRVGHHFYWIW